LTRIAHGRVRQEGRVDHVVGLVGQGRVHGEEVAARDELAEIGAVDLVRWWGDRVMGKHPHAEGGG
jgi:hypothetical protein